MISLQLPELKEKNYPGAKELYNKVFAWKAEIVVNNSEYSSVNMTSVSKYDEVYFHITMKGGPPKEETKVTYKTKNPDGGIRKNSFDFKLARGDEAWNSWYYITPAQASAGTLSATYYDGKGNEIGHAEVRITN